MIFNFIVKYLGFLKPVPFLPHLLDSLEKVVMVLSFSPIPSCLDEIEEELCNWPGVTCSLHRFGGIQFNINGKEFGHIHSHGLLDIRFNKIIKQQLMDEGKISHHHVFPKSGWIGYYICQKTDVAYALQLLRMSYQRADAKYNSISAINTVLL